MSFANLVACVHLERFGGHGVLVESGLLDVEQVGGLVHALVCLVVSAAELWTPRLSWEDAFVSSSESWLFEQLSLERALLSRTMETRTDAKTSHLSFILEICTFERTSCEIS